MWVRITRVFEWSPVRWGGRLVRTFGPGQLVNLPRAAAARALAAGAAEHATPHRDAEGGAGGEDAVQGA